MGNVDYKISPLVKKFIELEASENKVKNIFLYAGGGYGKTTAMCCLFKYLLDKGSNGEKIAPIYIDVKKLNFNKPNPIINYIHSTYSGSDTKCSDVENLFSDQAPEFSKKYTYYILIDGLNETNDRNKGNLIDIISSMAETSNIRFVISSRIKETFDKAPFCIFKLQKLNEEQIKEYLDKNLGKKYNEQTHVDEINKSLIEILQIPMFMKTFSKTYDKRSPYPDIYDEKTVRKADILDSYVQKILLNLKERTNSYDNHILEFVINFYLPALAFQMVKLNSFFIPNENFENINIVLNKDYFSRFFVPDEIEIISDIFDSKSYKPLTIGIKQFAVLIKINGYSFVHQIWRDYFVAKHIINCMNAEKFDDLEISVDENIRQFVGELVREYVDKYKYSKKPADKSIDENGKVKFIDNPDTRKCECDFENVIELEEAKMSPLNQFLQRHNLQKDEKERLSSTQTSNVIEIMKTSRNNHITANYSYLNLLETTFEFSNISNSEFFHCMLDETSFKAHNYLFRNNENFSYFNQKYAMSPSGKYYVCIFNHNFIIFEAKTNKEYLKSHLAILGNIQIQQIAFIDDNRLIVRYPYCLACFNIDARQLNIDNVFYFVKNNFYTFDDFLYGRIQLQIHKPYIPYTSNNRSEEFVLKLLENESEEIKEKYLDFCKTCGHEVKKGIDYDTLLELSEKMFEIIPREKYIKIYQAFLFGITNEDMFNIDLSDEKNQFLQFEGFPLDNFTLDRKNNTIYVSCHREIYKYNYYDNEGWAKFADNVNNGRILHVPKYGILSITNRFPIYQWELLGYNIYCINTGVSCCLYEILNEVINDEYSPIIDCISISVNNPILRIEFFGVNADYNKKHSYVYYNFEKGCLENINEEIRNDIYFDVEKLNYEHYIPFCYKIFDNAYCLIANTNSHYKEINMFKIDEDNINKKLICKSFKFESVKARKYYDNYVFIYVPGSTYYCYYDIEKKRFYSLLTGERKINIINANNEEMILPNLARSIQIEGSKQHYNDLVEKCKNTEFGVERILAAREKNICGYLINHNQKNVSLSSINSGNFTYFYDYNGLHVNLMQRASNGRKRIVLKTFSKEDSYVHRNYLMVFCEKNGKIKIYNINFGYFKGEYEFSKLLSQHEKDKLNKFSFCFFCKRNEYKS